MAGKKKQGQNLLHIIILLSLVCIMAVSGFGLVKDFLEKRRDQKEYERIARIAGPEEQTVQETAASKEAEIESETEQETEPPYISPVNFEELAKINPDIVGWIRIPDTNINYPIVQGKDNDVYLHKSFEGEESQAGCIFLDFESQKNMRGYNNILYGHHMRDGSMFKDVVLYKEEEYFKEHQYFELYTPEETIHLKAVACYYTENDPMVRKTRFKTRESFQQPPRRL